MTASVQGNDEATPYETIWSRVFPEEMWTGAISPLMFSWRCWGLNQCHSVGVHAFGYPEMDYSTQRLRTYCRVFSSTSQTPFLPPASIAMLVRVMRSSRVSELTPSPAKYMER